MGNAGEAVVGVVAAGDGVAVGAAANAGDVFGGDGAVGVVAVGDLVAVGVRRGVRPQNSPIFQIRARPRALPRTLLANEKKGSAECSRFPEAGPGP